jgi:hypothetical protein
LEESNSLGFYVADVRAILLSVESDSFFLLRSNTGEGVRRNGGIFLESSRMEGADCVLDGGEFPFHFSFPFSFLFSFM